MIEVLHQISFLGMAVAAGLVLIRSWRGPTAFDRVLAIEALALIVVGTLLLQAYRPVGRLFTDAALGLALFSFVGTSLMAYFLGKGEFPDG